MKYNRLILILLLSGFIFLSLSPEKQPVSWKDAIKNGLVSCVFKSNPESPHYMRPLLLVAQNLKNETIRIKVAPGQQFLPEGDEYQNLIITKEETITLKAREKKSAALYAMCTEATDLAPQAEIFYKPAKQANEKLSKTAAFISKNNSHNVTGQQAMWCVSNNNPIEEVMGPDDAEVRKLQAFVAELTNKPVPAPAAKNNYATNYYAPPSTEVSYKGSMTFSYSKPISITIALFDKNNIVVRELYSNNAVPRGVHRVEYAFDNSVYTDDFYFVRMICNGDIEINRKLQMN